MFEEFPYHKAFWIDCKQSLSFPSVCLAFLRASVELSSSEPRDVARTRRKRKIFLPLPIPSWFLSLISIIFTEFCARRISGTKTDYS